MVDRHGRHGARPVAGHGRAAGEAEREGWMRAGSGHRRQPDVMRVFDRRHLLAAIDQDREFRRQGMVGNAGLERREHATGQRPSIDLLNRIEAGGRADHDVADIVAAVGQWPEAGGDQRFDQRVGPVRPHAADLQVAAIGRVQDAAAEAVGRVRDSGRLGGGEPPAGQLHPADLSVQRRRKPKQSGTGRATAGAWQIRTGSRAVGQWHHRRSRVARTQAPDRAWRLGIRRVCPAGFALFAPRRLRQANRFYTTGRSDRRAIWSRRLPACDAGRRSCGTRESRC